MHRRKVLILTAISFAIGTCPVVYGASTSDTSPSAQQFSLSAQVNERPQLTRTDLDPTSVPKLTPAQPAAPTLSYADLAKPQEFNKTPKQPDAAASPSLGQESPNSAQDFMQERNVNWRGWVASMADRWYYVLHQYEAGGDMQFVTERAALFEFTCYANGQVGNVALKQSSGNLIYDHLQMIALMQTVPLPPFPPGTKRTSITLLQGWESHVKRPGETDYVPGSFGRNFPMEKVREWVKAK